MRNLAARPGHCDAVVVDMAPDTEKDCAAKNQRADNPEPEQEQASGLTGGTRRAPAISTATAQTL